MYKLASSSVWVDLATSSSNTQFDLTGARGETYIFRARALDTLGNISDWSEPITSTINWSQEIIINEIAWAGSSASASDEWLEFYNNTDSDIIFATTSATVGWQIKISGKNLIWKTIASPTISARGYYLIERNNSKPMSGVAPDAIFSLDNGISNTSAKIELFKPNGEKSDEVDCASGWFAGDATKYRTMERISSSVSGNAPVNWQSNRGPRVDPRAWGGGQIYGSPRMDNFGFISLNYAQEEDTRVLTATDNPYILEYYDIPIGKTLAINPGVVIKSYRKDSNIKVSGSLQVNAASDNKAIITSGRDQSFADNKSNTMLGIWASGTALGPKDWQGIWFKDGSSTTISGLEIRYAGTPYKPTGGMYPTIIEQPLRVANASVNIFDSSFVNNSGVSVYLENASSTISNVSFDSGDRAIQSVNSNLEILNCNFTNYTNTQGPVYIKDKFAKIDSPIFAGNTFDKIYFDSFSVLDTSTITRVLADSALFTGITVPAGTALNIESGADIKMVQYGFWQIDGNLQAQGTEADPIFIRPWQESEKWGRMSFNNSSSSLSYVNVLKGNLSALSPESTDGMLYANNSNLFLDHARLEDPRRPYHTLQSVNSIITMNNSFIGDENKYMNNNVPTCGVKVRGGALNLAGTNFSNLNYGLCGFDSAVLSAPDLTLLNFSNVDIPIIWPAWLGFPTSTTST